MINKNTKQDRFKALKSKNELEKSPSYINNMICRLSRKLAWLRPFGDYPLIRLGSDRDGGYVLPRSALDIIDGVLSFGIDRNWSFESGLRTFRPEIPLHAYDHTISDRMFYREVRSAWIRFFALRGSWNEVKRTSRVLADFRRTFSGKGRHFRQKMCDRVYGKEEADFALAIRRLEGKKNLLVKVDIEGDEYHILPDLLCHSKNIAFLVIEFHFTGVYRETFHRWALALQKSFHLVHLHANNGGGRARDRLPEFLELTFVRGRPNSKIRINRLPLRNLDQSNLPGRPDYSLVWC